MTFRSARTAAMLAATGIALAAVCSAAPAVASTAGGPSLLSSAAVSSLPVHVIAEAAGGDPNRPAKQCADKDLKVTVRTYGASAGHLTSQFVFTNTGKRSCQLRGYPGVSAVGHHGGTQLGRPAVREKQPVHTVTLRPGSSNVNAILLAVNLGKHGGALGKKCHVVGADGYRVYPPHSYRSVFVPEKGLRACTGSTPWMTIDPVTSNPK